MTWSFDSNSPQRDATVSVEEEVAWFAQPEHIPWRYKVVRLWRYLLRR